jgi:glycosyltransferase involved in cell wall biosynthesis
MGKYTNVNRLYGILAKIAYKNVNAVICQSKDMAIDFKEIHNIPTEKIFIINNPITELLPLKAKSTLNKPVKYITIGRLSKEKGHERLLYILTKIAHPFQYTIVGSGPEKKEIYDKISELGLENFITHIPFTTEIGKVLGEHDLFLQGSFVEGFPNAVLESCIVGTPVIAFDAPGGTKEILKNGINGYLVSSQDEFINKLKSFDKDKWEPQTIRDSVINKFNQQIILRQYEDLLLNL